MKLDKTRALAIVKAALKEDIGAGDITTSALIDKFASGKAAVIAKEDCVVCGLQIAEWAMAQLDYSVRFKPTCEDGSVVGADKEIVYLEGHFNSILRAERTMLNFLSFLSAVATKTRRFADKAKPYGARIMDTRKTLPLLRYLEKYAVSVGGGSNHRMGLYDQALIKDNHISVQRKKDISLKELVERCRENAAKGTVVEVEVGTVEEFADALAGKPDIIMLDNMKPSKAKVCVDLRRQSKTKALLEASGGITLDNVEEYARSGVDMISVGSLTASIKSIDMSLEIV